MLFSMTNRSMCFLLCYQMNFSRYNSSKGQDVVTEWRLFIHTIPPLSIMGKRNQCYLYKTNSVTCNEVVHNEPVHVSTGDVKWLDLIHPLLFAHLVLFFLVAHSTVSTVFLKIPSHNKRYHYLDRYFSQFLMRNIFVAYFLKLFLPP